MAGGSKAAGGPAVTAHQPAGLLEEEELLHLLPKVPVQGGIPLTLPYLLAMPNVSPPPGGAAQVRSAVTRGKQHLDRGLARDWSKR